MEGMSLSDRTWVLPWSHPSPYGGYEMMTLSHATSAELSLRIWRVRHFPSSAHLRVRIIPPCTEGTYAQRNTNTVHWNHPSMYGGYLVRFPLLQSADESSLHVRRVRESLLAVCILHRIIPPCTEGTSVPL